MEIRRLKRIKLSRNDNERNKKVLQSSRALQNVVFLVFIFKMDEDIKCLKSFVFV